MRRVGETFGRYTILARLTGGNEMYLCELSGAEGFARRVVAKRAGLGGTLQLERIQAAGAMSHPNLAQLIDVVRLDDGDYVVSEFVPGRSVRELQQRTVSLGRSIPLMALTSIGAQAARVLGWLGGRPAARHHGSLTPRNLMLGDDGGLKLTDFGSSSWFREAKAPLEILRYRAPEWQPGGSAQSDVFALGVVLWELLTNEPFAGPTRVSTEVPASLTDVLRQAVEPDPSVRPSARELEEVLTQCARELAASVDELSISRLLLELFPSGAERSEATQLVFAPAAASASTTLAGYRMGERLARLGPAELVRAEKDGCPCVLKIQRDPGDHLTHARLLKEARMLASIDQVGVWKPNELIETKDGRRILRGKAMGGETAASLIERLGGLRPEVALGLTRHVLGSVAAVHAAGFTGTTLEPETVFLCTDEDPFHPILMELGLLRESVALEDQQADLARVGKLLRVLLGRQPGSPAVGQFGGWLADRPLPLTDPPPAGSHPDARLALEARSRLDHLVGELR